MELQVYDQNFTEIALIDSYISLIWTKRYRSCGDFEIKMPIEPGQEIPEYIKYDNYTSLKEDPEEGYYMIIDTIETTYEEDNGFVLKVSGKSLGTILSRRIVWDKVTYTNRKTSYIVEDLLNKSIIKPSLGLRKIDNFLFEVPESTDDFSNVDAEYNGDNILTSVENLANEDDYGVSVLYDGESFICKLYKGTDRSYNQNERNIILFSSAMGNLLSSDYLVSTENYKNVILAIGQGTTKYILGEVAGLDRREYHHNASGTSNKTLLKIDAQSALKEHRIKELLDGEIISEEYEYGIDYVIGDVVQIRNDFGIERAARIVEMIFSEDSSGVNIYPTVEIINEEE